MDTPTSTRSVHSAGSFASASRERFGLKTRSPMWREDTSMKRYLERARSSKKSRQEKFSRMRRKISRGYELTEEEKRLLKEYEELERIEQAALEQAQEEFNHMDATGVESVLCPLCMRCALIHHSSINVYCKECAFDYTVGASLEEFRELLASSFFSHVKANTECCGVPKFRMATLENGANALVLQCPVCNYETKVC